jgi:hypothetical protein
MEDEIKSKLSGIGLEAAQGLLEWTKAANEFAVDQAPMLAQEIISWGITHGIILGSINVAFMAILVGFVAWLYRISLIFWSSRDPYDNAGHCMALGIGWSLVSVLGSALFCVCFSEMCEGIINALHAYTAPRLYIIETLSKLLGN